MDSVTGSVLDPTLASAPIDSSTSAKGPTGSTNPTGSFGDLEALAAALHGMLRTFVSAARRARDVGEVSAPEMAALLRLRRTGPTTSSALARLEGISPQAMGVTIASLETRGLVTRTQDPEDGRRMLLAPTDAGEEAVSASRSQRTRAIAEALAADFRPEELAALGVALPLLDRLAESL